MDTNILSPKALFQKDVRYTNSRVSTLSWNQGINGTLFGMMSRKVDHVQWMSWVMPTTA